MVTGVTFAAFASGFSVCLFNLDSVGECVAVAHSWVDTFRAIGNHVIEWGIAIFHGSFDSAKQ